MWLWWSLYTLYLLICRVRVTIGNSGLCCVCVTSFKCLLTPLCVDSATLLGVSMNNQFTTRKMQCSQLQMCTLLQELCFCGCRNRRQFCSHKLSSYKAASLFHSCKFAASFDVVVVAFPSCRNRRQFCSHKINFAATKLPLLPQLQICYKFCHCSYGCSVTQMNASWGHQDCATRGHQDCATNKCIPLGNTERIVHLHPFLMTAK